MRRLAVSTRFKVMVRRGATFRKRLSTSMADQRERFNLSDVLENLRARFRQVTPPYAITHIQPPALLVVMAGTTVARYQDAGQFGRLSGALERYSQHFKTVMLLTADQKNFTVEFSSDRVRHLSSRLGFGPSGFSILITLAVRLRAVRRSTSVVILDEQAATAGWVASKLSGSRLTMTVGAPWAPPRSTSIIGWRNWSNRTALRRVERLIRWQTADSRSNGPPTPNAENTCLPALVDSNLFCPVTNTDPSRPRVIGVFLRADQEMESRLVLATAERLARRGLDARLRVMIDGEGRESKANALNSETAGKDIPVEFRAIPPVEMLPDVLAHMRMCLSFEHPASDWDFLKAMSCGVPCVLVERPEVSRSFSREERSITRFLLRSSANEEQIVKSIETLLREPGIRLRMAREGRKFVVNSHSLAAVSATESRLLLGDDWRSGALATESSTDQISNDENELADMIAPVQEGRAEDLVDDQDARSAA